MTKIVSQSRVSIILRWDHLAWTFHQEVLWKSIMPEISWNSFFYLPRSSPLCSMCAKLHIRELNVPNISSEASLNPLIPSSCHSISTSLLLQHFLATLSHLALHSSAVFPRLKWAFLLLALWLLGWADLHQRPWHGPGTSRFLTDSSWHPWLHLGSAHSHSSNFILGKPESTMHGFNIWNWTEMWRVLHFYIAHMGLWRSHFNYHYFLFLIHRLQKPIPQLGFWLNMYAE